MFIVPHLDGLVVDRGSGLDRAIRKTIIKMVQTASLRGTYALGYEFDSATGLSIRPGSVWKCLWRHTLKRSHGINRMSRVLYPGPGFLSIARWPSVPKKHSNGLINQSSIRYCAVLTCYIVNELV